MLGANQLESSFAEQDTGVLVDELSKMPLQQTCVALGKVLPVGWVLLSTGEAHLEYWDQFREKKKNKIQVTAFKRKKKLF